jgi:uncharacterized membrane protein
MADYEQNGEPRAVVPDLDGSKAWCHLMYALHAFAAFGGLFGAAGVVVGFLFGGSSVIAVILNYITRGNVRGTWLESHWRWQLRTFWLAAAWVLGAVVLFFTFVGIPFALIIWAVLSVWVLYRVIRGWLALLDKRGMPVPAE